MGEGYVSLAFADDELLDQSFHDLALVLAAQRRPAVIQGIRLMDGRMNAPLSRPSLSPSSASHAPLH